MSSRSLNKVMLIGNVTRDPELRYTPNGTAVCSLGLATNRSWMPDGGTERREETEFHKLVAWNKLAELCSQLITKGRKIYIEGRLQTRSWETPDGEKRQATEIVIEDMMLLDARPTGDRPAVTNDSKPAEEVTASESPAPAKKDTKKEPDPVEEAPAEEAKASEEPAAEPDSKKPASEDEINLDDIPF
jgi:single-strand DNA-binding protein